jgi:hypothetical protein
VTTLYPQKLALTSLTGGGRSVGIVRSRTKAMEFNTYKESQIQLGVKQHISVTVGFMSLVVVVQLTCAVSKNFMYSVSYDLHFNEDIYSLLFSTIFFLYYV